MQIRAPRLAWLNGTFRNPPRPEALPGRGGRAMNTEPTAPVRPDATERAVLRADGRVRTGAATARSNTLFRKSVVGIADEIRSSLLSFESIGVQHRRNERSFDDALYCGTASFQAFSTRAI